MVCITVCALKNYPSPRRSPSIDFGSSYSWKREERAQPSAMRRSGFYLVLFATIATLQPPVDSIHPGRLFSVRDRDFLRWHPCTPTL
jgi:hypothetical protein